ENEQKRLRAVKKAARERDLRSQRVKELQVLLDECEVLRRKRMRLQNQIHKYTKFHQYLEWVVEASDEFQEVCDVVSRYHTLVATSSYLQKGALEAQSAIERAKGQHSHYLDETSDAIVQINNQLGLLQTRLEETQNQSLVSQSRWTHIQNTVAKKTLLLGTIKMAAMNLFKSIRWHSRESEQVAPDDTVRQLQMIEEYIRDLSDIWDEVKRKERDIKVQESMSTLSKRSPRDSVVLRGHQL
ncbi:coiled-coil domain-containing protein 42-like, partial [Discoglossus pictus]